MSRILALFGVLAVSGCATVTPTYLKNGTPGLSIDCSGQALSWDSCYEKADAACPARGYKVIGRPDKPDADDQVGDFKARTLVIRCR